MDDYIQLHAVIGQVGVFHRWLIRSPAGLKVIERGVPAHLGPGAPDYKLKPVGAATSINTASIERDFAGIVDG